MSLLALILSPIALAGGGGGGTHGGGHSGADPDAEPLVQPESQQLFELRLPATPFTPGGGLRGETSASYGSFSIDVRGTLVPIVVRTERTVRSDASAELRVTFWGFSGSAGFNGTPAEPGAPPPEP